MKNMKLNLQIFADGDNNDQAARSYQLEFKKLLEVVFRKLSYFADFFGGGIEVLDGVQENEHAFYVKTSDIPVVVGTEYSKDENTAFGTGTGKSTRFGERTEVIYKDTPVDYTWGWAYHEGIDRHTVNNDFDAAVADRLELQARAKTQIFNKHHGAFISETANTVARISEYTTESVRAVFNAFSSYFTNIGATGTRYAKVRSDLYNEIVDHQLTVNGKKSTVNIDDNELVKFKGFLIQEIPDELFQEGEIAYAYIGGVGKAFTGINTARTIESEDFDGVALQGAGKAGEYILPDNRKAVAKAVLEKLGDLLVTCEEGESGKTKATVFPAKRAENIYKYKADTAAAEVTYLQDVTDMTDWNGTDEITATAKQVLTIVEATADKKAVKVGSAAVKIGAGA